MKRIISSYDDDFYAKIIIVCKELDLTPAELQKSIVEQFLDERKKQNDEPECFLSAGKKMGTQMCIEESIRGAEEYPNDGTFFTAKSLLSDYTWERLSNNQQKAISMALSRFIHAHLDNYRIQKVGTTNHYWKIG